jgi:ParB-like chromosome segregation protein Spo0J
MTRRSLGALRNAEAPTLLLDDNGPTYEAVRDSRSLEGRVQRIPAERIEASPFQVRRVFSPDAILALAQSIAENGLIHEPRGRPISGRPGYVQLMAGEMRLRALRRLIESGRAEGVLDRDAGGAWLIPMMIEEADDRRAEAIVRAENRDRKEISAWEWALDAAGHRRTLAAGGREPGVRALAESLGWSHGRVAQYLRVADRIDEDVLREAGVVGAGGAVAHERLAPLPLAALERAALAAMRNRAEGAQALLRELALSGDSAASEHLAGMVRSTSRPSTLSGGFQINIRVPLEQVTHRQAAGYLKRLAPVVEHLAEVAAGRIPDDDRRRMEAALQKALKRLRAG